MFKKLGLTSLLLIASTGLLGADAAQPAPAPAAQPTAVAPAATTQAPATPKDRAPTSSNEIVLTEDNVLTMNTYFDSSTVAAVGQEAKTLDAKLPSGEALYLILDSGGGSIDAGLELIDNLNALNRPVKTITIFSASMGFQTVQGLGERLVLSNGTLMSHKAKGGFSGEFPGQLDSRYNYYLKRVQRLDEAAAGRTKGKHTLASYRNLIENEYWCDGADCVKEGFADRVVTASCGESLKGTKQEMEDRFLFMGMTIEIVVVRSKCPMVTGELGWNVYIDGKPLFSKDVETLVKGADPKKSSTSNSSSYDSYYASFGSYTKSYSSSKALEDLKASEIELLKKEIDSHVGQIIGNSRRVIKGY